MKKKTKHVITIDDVTKAIQEVKVELAGSYGDGSHKKLELIINVYVPIINVFVSAADVNYRVYNNKECVMETNSKYLAVEKYNELP